MSLAQTLDPPGEVRSTYTELRADMQRYFRENGLKSQGSPAMYGKTAVILVSWTLTYYVLLTYGPENYWVAAVAVAALTFFSIAVQLSVMHDVSHQSLSDRKIVNTCLNVTLTLAGSCSMLWHQKHIVRHHAYTNVPGEDPDIDSQGLFRLHAEEPWLPIHRWQHVYVWGLYCLFGLNWIFLADFKQTFGNVYNLRGRRYAWLWVELVAAKISHVVLFIVMPYLAFGSLWAVAALYLAHWLVFGLFISVFFQMAHVSGPQNFPGGVTTDWAEHQLNTTADFAVSSRLLGWLTGGLNFQVEHHIFPRVSHVHYPALQKIVKSHCEKRGLPYHEHRTLGAALRAHYDHLVRLGKAP